MCAFRGQVDCAVALETHRIKIILKWSSIVAFLMNLTRLLFSAAIPISSKYFSELSFCMNSPNIRVHTTAVAYIQFSVGGVKIASIRNQHCKTDCTFCQHYQNLEGFACMELSVCKHQRALCSHCTIGP